MLCVQDFPADVFENVPDLLERLKKKSAGLTWEALADAAGVDQRTIYKWKHPDPEKREGGPTLSQFGRMAELCGVRTLYELAEMTEGPRPLAFDPAVVKSVSSMVSDSLAPAILRATTAEAERDQLRAELDKLKG